MKRLLPAIPAVFFIVFALVAGNGWAHDDAHEDAGHGAKADHQMKKMDGHMEEGSKYKEKTEGMAEQKYQEYKKHDDKAMHLKEEGSGSSDMEKKVQPMKKKAEGSMR